MKSAFLVTVISISTFLSGVRSEEKEQTYQIPVLGSVGPRSHGKYEYARLMKVYDKREINNDLNFCYHSRVMGNGDPSRLTFIIQPALVSSIQILGRNDAATMKQTGVSNFVITLCRINSEGEKECSRMGSMSEGDECQWSELTFEETLADEIQIHHEYIGAPGYEYIVFCELLVLGQVPDSLKVYANLDETAILQNSRIEGATVRKLPVYGALAPPGSDPTVHSIVNTFDGGVAFNLCYVSNPKRSGLPQAWFFIDYAKITVVYILNGKFKSVDHAREMGEFTVSVCELEKQDGVTRALCEPCVATETAENGEWMEFVCDHVGDIVSLSRPVSPGDSNADFWLCEIQIWGHILSGIFPNKNGQEYPNGIFSLEDSAFNHEKFKEHQIPILGAVGPRADSKWEWSRLHKVYDHRESRDNVNFCYHSSVSENGDASRLTFIIHPAAVKSIRILGRGDMTSTGVQNFVVSLCRINSQGEKVCSRMGSMPEVDEDGWSELRFPITLADEIHIHHEHILAGNRYIVFCELLVFGLIPDDLKTYSHWDANNTSEPPINMKETTVMKMPVYGTFAPPEKVYAEHSILNVMDGDGVVGFKACYESNPAKTGLKEAWFFTDYAKVTLVKILNILTYDANLAREIGEFEVSVCELEEQGEVIEPTCEPCVAGKTVGTSEWMDFVCEHMGSIVTLTRPIKKDDVNAHFWLCEIQIWGHKEYQPIR